MAATGTSLAELAAVMTRLPQVLVNVPGVDKARADDDTVLAAAVAEAEAELGDTGRVLLRPSGTEPLVRVMVEAADRRGRAAASVAAAAGRPGCAAGAAQRLSSRRRREPVLRPCGAARSGPSGRASLRSTSVARRAGRQDVLRQVRAVDRVPDPAAPRRPPRRR